MKKGDILFEEDECAPDAREYFDKKLLKETGLTVNDDFIVDGARKYNEGTTLLSYTLGDYRIEKTACHQYWKLIYNGVKSRQ